LCRFPDLTRLEIGLDIIEFITAPWLSQFDESVGQGKMGDFGKNDMYELVADLGRSAKGGKIAIVVRWKDFIFDKYRENGHVVDALTKEDKKELRRKSFDEINMKLWERSGGQVQASAFQRDAQPAVK
jgi:hypothetical protein